MRLLWGSASERGYLLLLAYDLDLLNQKEYRQLNIQTLEAKKMLASFIKNQEANQHFS